MTVFMTVFMLQGNQLIVTDLLALRLISASIYFFMFAFTPDEEQLWQWTCIILVLYIDFIHYLSKIRDVAGVTYTVLKPYLFVD